MHISNYSLHLMKCIIWGEKINLSSKNLLIINAYIHHVQLPTCCKSRERCKSHNIFLTPEEKLLVKVEYKETRFSYWEALVIWWMDSYPLPPSPPQGLGLWTPNLIIQILTCMYSKIQQYTCMCPKCSSFMSSKLNQILIILLVARSIILQLCDQTLFSNFVVDEEIFLPTSSLGSLTLTPLSKSFIFFSF